MPELPRSAPPRPYAADRPRTPRALAELARPLDYFYAQAGRALPPLEAIEGLDVPQPLRRLLVHRDDMTPTLEAYYGDDIDLQVLGRRRRGQHYSREVVLRLRRSRQPVEFGANRIRLDLFPAEAQRLILEEREPLGHILRDFAIAHTCQPNAFLRVASDALINEALELSGAQVLYGRHNRLYLPDGRQLSEVVEILRHPPGAPGDANS
jgi:chorismate-pyruvate lyase